MVAPVSLLRPVAPATPGLIRPYHSKLALLNRMVEAAWVWVGMWVALQLAGRAWSQPCTIAAAVATMLFLIAAEWRDLYRAWRCAHLYQELGSIATAWLAAAVVLLFVGFLTRTSTEYPRTVVFLWFVVTPTLLCLWRTTQRIAFRELRKRGRNIRTVAIAGAGDLGVRVAKTMLANAWMGMKPVGFFDDRKPHGYKAPEAPNVSVVGDLDDLVTRAAAGGIDLIYLALPLRAEERVKQVINALSDTTVSVYVVPDIFAFDLLHARIRSLGGIPTVSVFENPFSGVDGWVKRVEDVVLASLILALIAVPMLLIALGVKLTSRGPVLFKQARYGLDGKRITVWKFRTMSVCEDGENVFTQARKCDPRVTRFGKFLRCTSLDELPQFFNVLAGTMSIVGPRPHPVALNENFRKLIHGYMLRHKVKPGITGFAQIKGFRGATDELDKMEKRVGCDLWYIRNWSLWLDLRIIAISVLKGFTGNNTY